MTVLPKVRDKRLKNGWRGSILLFNPDNEFRSELIAHVYGDTLEEMRERKMTVYKALDKMIERTRNE